MREIVATDTAPKPMGPYSQAVIDGALVYVSGQGPLDPATGRLELEDISTQTQRTLQNLEAILKAAGSSLGNVLLCTVYLKDIDDFAAMNAVYARVFKAPYPARTTIQAAALPADISVEIDCVARR